MALAAAYLLHEDMLCMTIGVAEGDRSLLNIGKVTSLAGAPGRDTAVFLFDRTASLDDIGDQHPVLLQDIHGVACLARVVPVLAHLPGLERLFHHMAGDAELGIFAGMFEIAQADDAADDRDEQEKDDDRLLVFFDEPDKEWRTGRVICHVSLS